MQEAMQSTSYGCKRAEDVRLFQGQPHSAEARLLQRGWGATQRHLETLEVDVEVDFKEAHCSKKAVCRTTSRNMRTCFDGDLLRPQPLCEARPLL